MKIKNLIATALISGFVMGMTPGVSNAEYITAMEDIHYEKYVLDTASFYFPDPKHKLNQFNCVVWYYTSEQDKGKSYTFRYRFKNNRWELAEKDGDKLVWETFEDTSPAADVLRVALPYLNHPDTTSNNTTKK